MGRSSSVGGLGSEESGSDERGTWIGLEGRWRYSRRRGAWRGTMVDERKCEIECGQVEREREHCGRTCWEGQIVKHLVQLGREGQLSLGRPSQRREYRNGRLQ